MCFCKVTFLLTHSALFFGFLSFCHIYNIVVAKQLYVRHIPPNLLGFLWTEGTSVWPALSQQPVVNLKGVPAPKLYSYLLVLYTAINGPA